MYVSFFMSFTAEGELFLNVLVQAHEAFRGCYTMIFSDSMGQNAKMGVQSYLSMFDEPLKLKVDHRGSLRENIASLLVHGQVGGRGVLCGGGVRVVLPGVDHLRVLALLLVADPVTLLGQGLDCKKR